MAAAGLVGASIAGFTYSKLDGPPAWLPVSRTESQENPKDWSSKAVKVNHNNTLRDRLDDLSQGETYSNADHSAPGQQEPPPQTKGHRVVDTVDDIPAAEISAWETAVDRLATVKDTITGFDFSDIGDKITDFILPKWIQGMPEFLAKIQEELSVSPGSLAEEVWHEAHDPEINPEIMWDARVRISEDICDEEQDFLRKRKVRTTAALARYLDVPEEEIHPDDVPTVAMCGSGGGLRALVAGTSSFLSAKEAGLFDCVTYTAGVSGSCWLQTLFYSSIGAQDHAQMIRHLKNRLGIHLAFPPAALNLLTSAPTNKFLLSGVVEKLKGVPDADFGLVDIYGVLLAARLLVPRGELQVDDYDLKISNQRIYTDQGHYPLPIYTAVRHEIPLEEQSTDSASVKEMREEARKEAWFQWFEWTPYEFFCEEFSAGIPTWAIGRKFEGGLSVWRDNGLALPELRVPLLMGVWGSAFCATLSHYYKEIRPIMRGLAGFGGIDSLIAERDEDLVKVHPIDPASIPNFALGMREQLPEHCPESVHTASHLSLMDAGMSNNLPIYPLLRPGRNVDILIAFDASADVRQDNWIKAADGYVRQRGIRGWPVGAGWPSETSTEKQTLRDLEDAQARSVEDAENRLQEAKDQAAPSEEPINKQEQTTKPSDLGYCTVWVGTTEERQVDEEPPPSKAVEEDWQLMDDRAGIAVIYFPFLANPKVPQVDPQTSDFMSTWNFVYTPDEIDKVVSLARANFEEGREQTKRTVKAVWERKRKQRLQREKEDRELRWRARLRNGRVHGKKFGEHGDHFS